MADSDKLKSEQNNEASEEKSMGLMDEDYYDLDEINARREARRQERNRRNKRARRRFCILVGAVILTVGGFLFSISSFFDVDSIEVNGNAYFSAEEIINMGHAVPGKNLIYHPNKGSIVDYLEQNPYIKKAKVSRHFPSTLVITVDERRQVGAITYDDDYLIIDDEGILLRKTRTKPKETVIEGIVISKIKLGEKIGVQDEELFEQTQNILRLMGNSDLYFVRLDMSEMYIKAYVYDSLICKGTYSQLTEGIEKGRVHKVLEKLFEDNIKRGTITLGDEGYASYRPTV